MANFFDKFDAESGLGIPIPPQQGMRVSPADQALRDRARLAILENEFKANPTDPDLTKEIAAERSKQGVVGKNFFDQFDDAPSPVAAPTPVRVDGVKDAMIDQSKGDFWTGLNTGIANSASRTARAIGTTLLPKAAEAWAEKHGFMPTARDLELLKAGTEATPQGEVASFTGDVLTEALPAAKAMRGATTLRKSLPRAMAFGGTVGGMRSEAPDYASLATDVAEGGVGGAIGEGAGKALTRVLTRSIPTSEASRGLMGRGIYPTLGDAADQNTVRGKVVKFLENQTEAMPITGAPQRFAKERVTRDLFNEAAEMGLPPGRVMPEGNRVQILDRLSDMSSQDFGAALAGTSMRATHQLKNVADSAIDSMKGRYYVSDEVADRIKQEMNQKLWAGIRSGEISGQGAHNFIEDMFTGLNATRGNGNAQQLVNELALGFKNRLNDTAVRQGFDLPGIRQSAANIHALRRAGGTREGVSGEQLMRGVQSNNRATNSLDATYDLQRLAEEAQGITHARNPMGNRNPLQFLRDFAGAGTGLGLPALGLGAVNNSQHAKRLLLGDPAYRAAMKRALTVPATVAGTRSLNEEQY